MESNDVVVFLLFPIGCFWPSVEKSDGRLLEYWLGLWLYIYKHNNVFN